MWSADGIGKKLLSGLLIGKYFLIQPIRLLVMYVQGSSKSVMADKGKWKTYEI